MGQPRGGTDIGEGKGAPARRATDPLSPVQAFLFVLALLAIAGLAIYFTTGGGAPAPVRLHESQSAGTNNAGERASDRSVVSSSESNRQAIKAFHRIYSNVLAAYRHRDASLLHDTFTSNSRMKPVIIREIRQIKRDRVFLKPHFDEKSIVVKKRTQNRLVLRQVAVVDFHFFDESGADVTTGEGPLKRTVERILKWREGRWLLHDSVVTASSRVRSHRAG